MWKFVFLVINLFLLSLPFTAQESLIKEADNTQKELDWDYDREKAVFTAVRLDRKLLEKLKERANTPPASEKKILIKKDNWHFIELRKWGRYLAVEIRDQSSFFACFASIDDNGQLSVFRWKILSDDKNANMDSVRSANLLKAYLLKWDKGEEIFSRFSLWDEKVYIYADFKISLLGRSQQRKNRLLVRSSDFLLSEHKICPEKEGFLTPLVVSEQIKKGLSILLQGKEHYENNIWTISSYLQRGEKVYKIQHKSMGFQASFSLERAGKRQLQEIEKVYQKWPAWYKPVLDHYKNNLVLRIHSAENVSGKKDFINYTDAMIAATLLADKEQWLWGVHDGRGLLEELLETSYSRP